MNLIKNDDSSSEQQQNIQSQQLNANKVIKMTLQDIENEIKNQYHNKQRQQQQQRQLKKCSLRQGCQDIHNYKKLNKIHQGIYGVVYRALQLPTNNIYAVKKLKIIEGGDFPITSLREISILRNTDHPNIMKIYRVAGSPEKDKVYIVMEYVDHEVKELLKAVSFKQSEVKRLMEDLLKGIAYLHERKIVHRDLKTSNLLYSNDGILKICDFGLARKAAQALMTQQVITMWYRPPELLLGEYHYSTQIDLWSIGCIMAELIIGEPIFKGKTQLEQLDLIFRAVCSPTEQTWPDIKSFKNYMYVIGKKYPQNKLREMIPQSKLSNEGIDLLKALLTANPRQRIPAKKALNHAWFKSDICLREQMPKHQPINESDRVKKRVKKNEELS